MKNPELLLRHIADFKKELERQGQKLPPGLAGLYGEFLAFKKIQDEFGKKNVVNFGSGQKGADIQILGNRRRMNIEVKTSRLKDEDYGMWYGAALNVKKCKKHDLTHDHPKRGKVKGDFCYFDVVVFVALADDFTEAKYYVIPRSFIEKNEIDLRNTHKRFSSATHRIIISDGKKMPRMSLSILRTIKKTEKFENRWDLIACELSS